MGTRSISNNYTLFKLYKFAWNSRTFIISHFLVETAKRAWLILRYSAVDSASLETEPAVFKNFSGVICLRQ